MGATISVLSRREASSDRAASIGAVVGYCAASIVFVGVLAAAYHRLLNSQSLSPPPPPPPAGRSDDDEIPTVRSTDTMDSIVENLNRHQATPVIEANITRPQRPVLATDTPRAPRLAAAPTSSPQSFFGYETAVDMPPRRCYLPTTQVMPISLAPTTPTLRTQGDQDLPAMPRQAFDLDQEAITTTTASSSSAILSEDIEPPTQPEEQSQEDESSSLAVFPIDTPGARLMEYQTVPSLRYDSPGQSIQARSTSPPPPYRERESRSTVWRRRLRSALVRRRRGRAQQHHGSRQMPWVHPAPYRRPIEEDGRDEDYDPQDDITIGALRDHLFAESLRRELSNDSNLRPISALRHSVAAQQGEDPEDEIPLAILRDRRIRRYRAQEEARREEEEDNMPLAVLGARRRQEAVKQQQRLERRGWWNL